MMIVMTQVIQHGSQLVAVLQAQLTLIPVMVTTVLLRRLQVQVLSLIHYILNPKVVNYGQGVASDETISYTNQKPGALVQFIDQNASTNGTRYTQPVGVIGADGTWSGKLIFSDTPDSTVDTDYTGLLKIGSSSIYYSWQVRSEALIEGEIEPPVAIISPEDGAGMSNVSVTPAAEGITGVAETTTVSPVYSSMCTSPGALKNIENCFDGDVKTKGEGVGGLTFTPLPPIAYTKSVEIHHENTSVQVRLNGGNWINTDADWVTIATGSGVINTLEADRGASDAGWTALRVDGRILIDGDTVNTATLTYTTDKSLDLLADGQSMTQQPAYTPVTDTIESVDETTTSVKYAIAPTDVPTSRPDSPTVNDQTGLTFVSATAGQTFTGNDHYIYDQGNNPKEPLRIVPLNGTAGYCYSDDLINWTYTPDGGSSAPELDNPLDKGRYIWIESTPNGYAGLGWSITGGVTVQPTLTFNSPKDIVNFRPGDVVQTEGTGNAAWNETQAWSNGWTDDSTFFSAGAEAYRGRQVRLFF